jgi:hypothetical protein
MHDKEVSTEVAAYAESPQSIGEEDPSMQPEPALPGRVPLGTDQGNGAVVSFRLAEGRAARFELWTIRRCISVKPLLRGYKSYESSQHPEP